MAKRRNFADQFMAKVAVEALRGDKTVQAIRELKSRELDAFQAGQRYVMGFETSFVIKLLERIHLNPSRLGVPFRGER